MAYYKDGAFAQDSWQDVSRHEPNGETIVPADHVIVSLEQWKAAPQPADSNSAFGLFIPVGQALDKAEVDFNRFALIALEFPKYVDGRAYSMARKLRDDYGFTGEIRATGDVLFDQLDLMVRCGFDAFVIGDANTIRLLENERKAAMTHYYQPAKGAEIPAGTRPWARNLR